MDSPAAVAAKPCRSAYDDNDGNYMDAKNRDTVMIVDDMEPVRKILHRFVEQLGYLVVGEAGCGHDAIAMANTLRPGIILMDYHMDDMSGVDALVSIHRSVPSTKVLIMTGEPLPSLVQMSMKAGACNFIPKPCFDELPGILRAMNRNTSRE